MGVSHADRAPVRDPTIDYDFLRADNRHKHEITNLILNGFLAIEPHCVAFGLNANNGRDYIDRVVAKSLKYPYSVRIIHKATGKLIGCRLMSVCDRPDKVDSIVADRGNMEEGMQMYFNLFDKLETQFWQRRPEANKILRREITFVHEDHQRRGIAQHLLYLGLDFDRLRAYGIDGIISEASSMAHQQLLLKKGFQEVARSNPIVRNTGRRLFISRALSPVRVEDYIQSNGQRVVFPDATTTCKQLYMSIQQRAHI